MELHGLPVGILGFVLFDGPSFRCRPDQRENRVNRSISLIEGEVLTSENFTLGATEICYPFLTI